MNPEGKGLFVLLQGGNLNSDLKIYPADGRWDWAYDHFTTECGGQIPVFLKGAVDRINGNFDTDRIGYPDPITAYSFIEAYIDQETGEDVCYPLHRGDGKDVFNLNYKEVFSPWSNPKTFDENNNVVDIAFEVVDDLSGTIKIMLYIEDDTQTETAPSKPHLGWDPRDLGKPYEYGWIYLAWGADFWDGEPIEPDYEWSELQRKIDTGPWITVYSGPNRVWSDGSITYDPEGSNSVYFRVRIRDTQGLWSLWSDLYNTKMIPGIPHADKYGFQNTLSKKRMNFHWCKIILIHLTQLQQFPIQYKRMDWFP